MRKKRLLHILFCGILIALLTISAFAEHDETDIPYAVTGGNIWFEELSGSITDCDDDVTEVVVPEKINDVTVNAIGNYAFAGSCIKKVTLPNTVTKIRPEAFWNCNGIINIKLPESIEYLGEGSFGACYNLRRFSVPSRVKSIEPYVFCDCRALLSITILSNVNEIKTCAFQNCTELTDVYYEGTQEQWNAITIETGNEYLLAANLHTESSGPELPATEPVRFTLATPSFGAFAPISVTGTGTRSVNFYAAFYNQNSRFIGLETAQRSVYPGLQSVFVPISRSSFVPTIKAFALDDEFRPLSPASGQDAGNGENFPEKYSAILSESNTTERDALVDALTEQEAKELIKQFTGWLH